MDTTRRQHIANVIQTSRLRRGWSVGQAAQRIGVDASGWSRWESATTTPRPARLVELGELFDLPADWTTPQTTTSHPMTTVDSEELLERIRAELAEHELRIARMLERHMKGNVNGTNDDDGAGTNTTTGALRQR